MLYFAQCTILSCDRVGGSLLSHAHGINPISLQLARHLQIFSKFTERLGILGGHAEQSQRAPELIPLTVFKLDVH